MTSLVQEQAARIVAAVLDGRSLTRVLDQRRSQAALSAGDMAAVQDIAYGTVRWLGRLRAIGAALTQGRTLDRDVEALLLGALYQLDMTSAAPHAVVDGSVRACAALRKTSAKPLVNAVLRNFLRAPAKWTAAAERSDVGRFSHPQWWIDLVRAAYPHLHTAILDVANGRPPMTLRVNRRAMSARAYMSLLEEAGLGAEEAGDSAVILERPVSVERVPGFAEGLVSVQDLGAQRAVHLLDLHPGDRVLDACAAPGGKAGHALEFADIELVAIDLDGGRLQRVRDNLERLRLRAQLIEADVADFRAWWDGLPFSRILLDAPCSGSGVVRRHPDIKWLRRVDDLPAFAVQQSRLIEAVWHMLEPGGTLLYVTCSIFPQENQAIIDLFLERHANARMTTGADANGSSLGQLLPDSRQDGFFYARLDKAR